MKVYMILRLKGISYTGQNDPKLQIEKINK